MLLISLCCTLPTAARAQDSLPHFALHSENDVITALGLPDGIYRAFPRTQMVALEGQRVIPWLEEIATTPTLALGRRASAMEALGLMRDSAAAAFLIKVIREHSNDLLDPIAGEAEADLVGNFDAVTCAFWRARLRQLPPSVLRSNAVVGLGYCDPSDSTLIRQAERGVASATVHEIADSAIARLRRPPYARRVPNPWGALPQPDGRYVPSEDVRRRIIAWMCPNGCPVEPLPPNYSPQANDHR